MAGKLGELPIDLRHGVARRTPDGLAILLAGAPPGCDSPTAANAPSLTLPLPPGPGGRYYAGATIGLETSVVVGEQTHWFDANASTVSLREVTVDDGASIAGSISLHGREAYGTTDVELSGTFTIDVCAGGPPPRPVGLPDVAPPGALSTSPALAYRDRATGLVNELRFFDKTAPPCGARPNPHTFFLVTGFAAPHPTRRGPQPARLMFHPPVPADVFTGGSAEPAGEAAVEWDNPPPPGPAGSVRGHLVTAHGPYGRFNAKLCR